MTDQCVACEWRVLGPKLEEQCVRCRAAVEERMQRLEVLISELAKEMRVGREADRHSADKRHEQLESRIQVLSNEIAKTRLNGVRMHEQVAIDQASTKARVAGLYALAAAGGSIVGGVAVAVATKALGG